MDMTQTWHGTADAAAAADTAAAAAAVPAAN